MNLKDYKFKKVENGKKTLLGKPCFDVEVKIPVYETIPEEDKKSGKPASISGYVDGNIADLIR